MKLTCGLSKSVGGVDGGRSASVSVEVELDPVTFRQPGKLKAYVRRAFDRVRDAIDEEVARPDATAVTSGNGGTVRPRNGSETRSSRNGSRPATASQLRILKTIAGRTGSDLDDLVRERLGKDTGSPTLSEASGLIDALGAAKGRPR